MASAVVVIGSVIMPDSLRLTRSTIDACSSMERLRWMMPRPPSRAIAIAMRDSVTVSMSDEMIGIGSRNDSEMAVVVSASFGRISE